LKYQPLLKLTGHAGSIYTILPYDEKSFLSAGGDGYVVKWNLYENEETGRLIARDDAAIYCAHLNVEKDILLVGNMNGIISIIDMKLEKIIHTYQAHKHSVFNILCKEDTIYSIGGDGNLTIFELVDLKIKLKVQISHSSLRCLIKKNNALIIGGSNGFLNEINLQTFEISHQTKVSDMSVFCMTQNDEKLYVGGRDCKVHQLDAHLNRHLTLDAHMSTINDIAWTKDLMITACRDKSIRLWLDGHQLVQTLSPILGGHINSVNKLLCLNDDIFYSCSDDRSIIKWGMSDQ
jgi:WD40 repeat protein